ncbi:hypothetical protein [Streptomyces sp. NPDC053069]|uniref:hypothetical protein n=1 Tax=Streptomyces sp. NPDC053069 TaxID=3365695 RepID=UPI0037D52E40
MFRPVIKHRLSFSAAPEVRPLPAVKSARPAPGSADYGFFGSRPLSRAAALPSRQGGRPVDRRLP